MLYFARDVKLIHSGPIWHSSFSLALQGISLPLLLLPDFLAIFLICLNSFLNCGISKNLSFSFLLTSCVHKLEFNTTSVLKTHIHFVLELSRVLNLGVTEPTLHHLSKGNQIPSKYFSLFPGSISMYLKTSHSNPLQW